MNYRHAFHAGNFADVLKHFVLVELMSRMKRKDAGLFVLDTHAGRGHYPLDAIDAQRGGEFREGIVPVLAQPEPPAALRPYLALVRRLGEVEGRLASYPGSPRLILELLRPQDRAAFCELEPMEAQALRATIRGDRRGAVHERDGYEAMGALLPPTEKRGLVLIDPPYEDPREFDRLCEAVGSAHRRWPTGVYAIWFPVTGTPASDRFLAAMQGSGIRRQLVVELLVRRRDSPVGLNGAGMLLINPPWQLEEALTPVLQWLARLLGPTDGTAHTDWLVGE